MQNSANSNELQEASEQLDQTRSRVQEASEALEFRRRWTDAYPVDPYYSPALNPLLARIYEAL